MAEMDLTSFKAFESARDEFFEFVSDEVIHKNFHIENSENCHGDYIFNSRNVRDTFMLINVRIFDIV